MNPDVAVKGFTPGQLRTAYGVEASGSSTFCGMCLNVTGRGTTAVVLEFGQIADQGGFEYYRELFHLGQGELHQVNFYGGALNPDNGEAVEDVETIIGIAKDVDRITLLNGTGFSMAMLLALALDPQNTGGRLADVISVSYGSCELHNPRSPTTDNTDHILKAAALAGVTVVFASGDQGSTDCINKVNPPDTAVLAVDWPASSPYVTSVGGTNLELNADNTIRSSEVWNDWPLENPQGYCCNAIWAGGGGDSTRYTMPWYQQAYFGHQQTAQRSVPDVSFLADKYPGTITCTTSHTGHTCQAASDGTSQAAPIFAGLVLLFNEHAALQRQPKVGFANPLLYLLAKHHADAFFDITTGNNKVGPQSGEQYNVPCCVAQPGYDKASGLGSLIFSRAAQWLTPRVQLQATGPTAPGATTTLAVQVTPAPAAQASQAHRYLWDINGDGNIDHETATPTLSYRIPASGSATISVTVKTFYGRTAHARLSLVSSGEPSGVVAPGNSTAPDGSRPATIASRSAIATPTGLGSNASTLPFTGSDLSATIGILGLILMLLGFATRFAARH